MRVVERFLAHRLAVASLAALALFAVLAAAAPLLSPYDPQRTDLFGIFQPPSAALLFGTDSLGRDLATRVLYGGRVSMTIGLSVVLLAVSIGTLVGGVSGFYGGWVDAVLMRAVDVMYAFPRLFLLILFAALFGGKLLTLVLVLGALSWMTTARLVRATFLSVKERDFVLAARSLGATNRALIVRHVLPNSAAPIIVAATIGVAGAILAESTLSFLGLGVQPPTPTWGNLLRDAQTDMTHAPWTAVFPGLAIFLAVVSINFVGDGLRDALDPHR